MKKTNNFSARSRCVALVGAGLISFALLLLVDAQSQTCHLRELDLCAATMLVLTQSPGGMASNEQEINKQCVHLREADGCVKNYTRRCMTPMQRELVFLAANSSFQLLDEYCTKGSTVRTSYLKHAQCLNQVQKKDQKGCVVELQAALELLTGIPHTKRLALGCCIYRKFDSCMSGHLEKRCGKEAHMFVNQIVRQISSRLPETLCRSYKPDGQECRSLLPKPGTVPKGAKSNSIFSKLLSAYSGL